MSRRSATARSTPTTCARLVDFQIAQGGRGVPVKRPGILPNEHRLALVPAEAALETRLDEVLEGARLL